ncbi:MAG: filamentous hemagglutinin N-terminal domain-containing protein [Sulfuritalea sp.]|nr:filamentous hemagglutinin N-terminal domain-containing protein [Sulfuritalea sp.]
MKSSYRSIPNEKTGALLAASTTAANTGRKSSSAASAFAGNPRFALKGLAVSLMLAFGANVYALPVGGVVAAGGASISSTAGSTTITQSSQNVAINWQSFSIGATEAVQFVQPNSSSVALNRVLGADPSSILGSMSANGKVFLINPNGVLFGKNAQINVGGLIASTLNITDSDFMAGRYQFSGNSDASILNQGSINADGGYVALLGANVSNEGIIIARLGTVALAAGNAITLDVAGDGLLNVTVSQGAVNALIQNGGLIQADGGQVLLTAMAAGTLLQSAVNNTGVIQAQTIENHNGTIRLMGDMQGGTTNVGGTLDVSGVGAGQTGGTVTLTGHHVGLFGANINAAGDTGGGTVLVGGDYQGKNPAVQNAAATYMSADSMITADAITNGNGGKVILWSDESTRANGSISARGGALGGNGGLIETSGHWLDVFGISANASAPNGNRGLWLLDPADVTIVAAATANGSFGGGNPDVFTPTPGQTTATVDVATIVGNAGAGLTGGTDVTINTANNAGGAGDITVAAAITWVRIAPGPASTLTLNATRDTIINAAITTDFGNLVVCCGRDISVNAPITTTDGSVLLAAGRDIFLNQGAAPGAWMTTTRGNITLCAGNDLNVTGKIVLTDFADFAGNAIAFNTGLGLADGLTLIAGANGTGPGAGTGTLTIAPRADPAEITRAPVNIYYSPVSYAGVQPDYSTGVSFANPGDPHTQYMLVFPDGANKTFDGSTATTFTGLKGNPAGVTLNPGAIPNFDTAAVGDNKTVNFTGWTLTQGPIVTGGVSTNYALATSCCGPAGGKTIANITAAPPVVPPVPPMAVPAYVAEEMLGGELAPEAASPWIPTIVQTTTPPQLLAFAPEPVPVLAVDEPVVVPAETPPRLYVPPVRLRKQDRN